MTKLGDQLNPLREGDYVQLHEDVLFGPICVLRVDRVFKNGKLHLYRFDALGRKTEVWCHWTDVDRCEHDTPPSREWIAKLVGDDQS